MREGGRIAAAIAVLETMEATRRPVHDLLKEWGIAHRFAGSRDRSAIGSLVFDVLRRKGSLGLLMGEETPRALVLAAYVHLWGRPLALLEKALSEDAHAPPPLTDKERAVLQAGAVPSDAPLHLLADLPEWLVPSMARVFGSRLLEEGKALAERADIDLRVNLLKARRDEVLSLFAEAGARPTPWSPLGIRLPAGHADDKPPFVTADLSFKRGLFEIQDEGSQVAALIAAGKTPGQIVDLCSGSGGKALTVACALDNRGQIYAFDSDKRRFGDILERIARSGARNIQIREPRSSGDPLADLKERADTVLVDAPCTGSGTWRRRPDAKWRLAPGALEIRQREQAAVLEAGARLVRKSGRLVYVTCSVLPEENEDQLDHFLARHTDFVLGDTAQSFQDITGRVPPETGVVHLPNRRGNALRLTPATTGTDGFFIAVLVREETGLHAA